MPDSLTRRHRAAPLAAPLVALAGLLALPPTQAAEWQHAVTPYLWASGMSGKAAVGTPAGPLEADVDVGFSDILRNLKLGGMVSYRGERGPWVVMTDAIYMKLGADRQVGGNLLAVDGRVEVEQIALEADVGYRLSDAVVAFVGLRYNDIDADLRVVRSGPGAGNTRAAGETASWVDPVVGVTAKFPLAERWSLGLRGDVGGFGVGADLAVQAMVSVHWQASDRVEVVGGWRYLDVDYEDGRDASLFRYDVATSGPGIGVTFRF